MNSKLAKRLRNKSKGNEATYSEPGVSPQYQTFNGLSMKTSKGTPRRLSETCTRYKYKQLKKAY